MKYTDVQDLIRAHYNSEEEFHNTIESIIQAEEKAGRDIAASRIRATINQHGGKKREGYTVKALHGLSAVNKNNNTLVEIRQSDISLKDVIAPTSLIDVVKDSINEYRCRDVLAKYGLEVSNKVLLTGPPGVGKTWMATAIAGELGIDLVMARWDSVISSYLGSTGANIRKIFEGASAEPVVLLIDECDAGAKERGSQQEIGEMNRVVITLLQNIDMFPKDSFLVAATNHGHLLDSAIWRRFTVINMELPGPEERRGLIEYYSKGLPITVDLLKWVETTEGLSGAEIKARIQREAKQYILWSAS
jgi:AAA+ superfamily predicted ATPase